VAIQTEVLYISNDIASEVALLSTIYRTPPVKVQTAFRSNELLIDAKTFKAFAYFGAKRITFNEWVAWK
jgi:hypothetical protein